MKKIIAMLLALCAFVCCFASCQIFGVHSISYQDNATKRFLMDGSFHAVVSGELDIEYIEGLFVSNDGSVSIAS